MILQATEKLENLLKCPKDLGQVSGKFCKAFSRSQDIGKMIPKASNNCKNFLESLRHFWKLLLANFFKVFSIV